MIASKGTLEQVATIAHGLAADLLRSYPVPLTLDNAPYLVSGSALFKQTCAACHGMTGDGRGPNAAKLSAPPIAFNDADRACQRSVFALYLVVTQGIYLNSDAESRRSVERSALDGRLPRRQLCFHRQTSAQRRAAVEIGSGASPAHIGPKNASGANPGRS